MRSNSVGLLRFFFVPLLVVVLTTISSAQVKDRIIRAINDEVAQPLRGNIHPHARPEFDQGSVNPALPMQRVTLFFKASSAQQADLESLLAQQQDSTSPNYHKWLTPEQYADRFGLSQSDFAKVVNWLQSKGLTVVDIGRGRTYIAVNGTAAQVSSAFGTEIHQFLVNGETHYANATEPILPSALAGVVLGIRQLNDFRPQPHARVLRKNVNPNFTSNISGNHFLAPDDVATIYDLKSLYSAGINGTGQKIVIVGQTDIVLSDISTFRSVSKLPASTPQVILVPGATDPGVVAADVVEADLDLEWAGAVARDAKLIFVKSKNVFDSLTYAVDQNLAPVISISYGDCEPHFSGADIASLTSLGQQANAQGQTIVSSTGDSGAADCDFSTDPKAPIRTATHGLAVDIPAAMPFVTGAGGSEFNEGTGTFWNTTNNSSNGSAISYIPEMAWNDTASSIAAGGGLSAGGGGKSIKFPKPSWQTGPGVPDDGARDVPDISLSASPEHDGYLICSQGSCVNGYRAADTTLNVVGGTSVAAPVFAGMVALINQKTGSAQGNVNPRLYQLAASTTDVFHDITSGDNKVPCTTGTTDCPSGGAIGFSAGPDYDLATGLGSVAGFNLVNEWGSSAPADFQLSSNSTTLTFGHGTSSTATMTVAPINGFSAAVNLTCSVASTLSGVTCAVSPASVSGSGTATLTVTSSTTAQLRGPGLRGLGWTNAGFVFAAGLVFVGRRRKPLGGLFALALIAVLTMAACGGGGGAANHVVTPLSGSVTVQATSGSLSHSVQLAVTVN